MLIIQEPVVKWLLPEGSPRAPEPRFVGFIGSIKWRESGPFSVADLHQLAQRRATVPGAGAAKLVAVSRTGTHRDVVPDATFGPEDLLAAWR